MIYADHGLPFCITEPCAPSKLVGMPSDAIEPLPVPTGLVQESGVSCRAGLERDRARPGRLSRPWRLTDGLSTNTLIVLGKLVL